VIVAPTASISRGIDCSGMRRRAGAGDLEGGGCGDTEVEGVGRGARGVGACAGR